MDGDNILKFPLPKTAVDSRTEEITLLAEDIAELLHGEGGTLDLSDGERKTLRNGIAAGGKQRRQGAPQDLVLVH